MLLILMVLVDYYGSLAAIYLSIYLPIYIYIYILWELNSGPGEVNYVVGTLVGYVICARFSPLI